MEVTDKLGLKKPGEEDFYDVQDFNHNADVIDAEVSKIYEKIEETSEKIEDLGDIDTGIKLTTITVQTSAWTANGEGVKAAIQTGDSAVTLGNVFFSPASMPYCIKAGVAPYTTCTSGVVTIYAEKTPTAALTATLETRKEV